MSFFESAYAGTPPWDIGHPQPAFVAAEDAGEVQGPVLDVGCGTGEHALFFASRGHEAAGIDGAPTAIRLAKAKARKRGLTVDFRVHDALRLPDLGRTFGAIVDSGLFHVFEDAERAPYVRGLAAALAPGGSYHVLCFSDKEPPGWGPRRIARKELRAAFARHCEIDYIKDASFDTNLGSAGVRAYFARMRKRAPS